MSPYGHQMEREFSVQSLSRGDTGMEMGSRYVAVSGFYITSFAAAIFIAGLETIGVLLLTLVVSLAVMLQSCENRRKGVVDIEKASDSHLYCKIFALYGELNGFKADEVPPVCRSLAVQYIKGGYARDLNFTMRMIESFFNTVSPSNDHVDVVLMDIDDASDPRFNRSGSNELSGCIDGTTYLKHWRTLELYMELHSRGWSLILLLRKPERQRNVTIEHLNSIGNSGWSSLVTRYCRLDGEMEMETSEYFSKRRAEMKKQGNEIISVICSQMDAITGSSLGIRVFKLPNPLYYSFENHIESWRFLH